MKNKFKKLLSIIMVVVMTACAVPMKEFRLNAGATSKSSSDAVAWVNNAVNNKIQYGNGQCVALIRSYYDFLGVSPQSGNAKDYATNALPSGWTFSSSPNIGDIAVNTGSMGGGYGHVVIVISISSSSKFIGADQNNSGRMYVGTQSWNVSSFSKFIHPNFSNTPTPTYADPKVNLTYWGQETETTFRPVVEIANPETVDHVSFPTWSGVNYSDQVQNNLNWYGSVFNGGSSWFNDINYSDFSYAIITTHVYVYGKNGSVQSFGMQCCNKRLSFNLDINMDVCGVAYDSGYSGNTFDLYLNGSLVANDVKDYCQSVKCGTKFEVKDVKSATGYYFAGGTTTGTVTGNIDARLKFEKNGYELKFDVNHDNIAVNLYKPTKSSKTINGVTYSYNQSDNTITLNGTLTTSESSTIDIYNFKPEANTTYQVSAEILSGSISVPSGFNSYFVIEAKNKNKEALSPRINIDFRDNVQRKWSFTSTSASQTEYLETWLWKSGSNITFSNWKIRIKIEKLASSSEKGTDFSPCMKGMHYGEGYGTLMSPTREGYSFDGWYTSKEGGTKITSSSTYPASNQTLYAHWTANGYTVAFNANGGVCTTSSKSVTYGSTYGSLPTPTQTGYSFDGWYTLKDGDTKITADSKVSITADQTLYAHWTKKEIIIKKDSNIVFDEENNLIMNVPEGISNLDNLLEINGLSLKYEETANGFGTGTKVKVMDGTSVLKTYTIVVPCDVTGDGYCDAFDVSLLSSVANYETEFEENSAYLFAGDNVQDGFIDSFDVSVLTAKANYEI